MADLQSGVGATPAPETDRKYARLSVRIRGAMYDVMILTITIVLTITFTTASQTDAAAQAIGAIGVLLVLLYEPVMVWAKGGTFGHMACNMRVVDDHSLANPSFPKATARFAIKAVLGWFSFLTMMASRRHRAVHDILTGSTVQVRNINRLKNYEFASEISEPVDQKTPTTARRIFSIIAYFIISTIITMLIIGISASLELYSSDCIDNDRCSFIETIFSDALALGWLTSLFVIVGLGWRGLLPGFRARS